VKPIRNRKEQLDARHIYLIREGIKMIGPLLMCFMILALDWRKAPIETMSTADDSTGKQRQDSTMNPVLMPQNTSEQFEML
jgi:hypothetical protein